jgi:hypothetical protein
MTLFTFIGCEQSPISPVGETDYMIQSQSVVNNVPVALTSNKNRVTLDSILVLLNLTKEQKEETGSIYAWSLVMHMNVFVSQQRALNYEIRRTYQLTNRYFTNKIKELGIDITDPKNKPILDSYNQSCKESKKAFMKKYSDEMYYWIFAFTFDGVRSILTPTQQVTFDKWVATQKLEYYLINPEPPVTGSQY